MDLVLLLSVLGVLLAVPPLAAYLAARMLCSPRIEFRVAGEHLGEPIPVPQTGHRFFAVATRSSRKVELYEVWVAFEPDEVDLSGTHAAEIRPTLGTKLETKFPFGLFFGTKRVVAKRQLQANFFDYKAQAREFSVLISAIGKVDETGLPFLLDMFSTKKFRVDRVVRFEVVDNPLSDFQDSGLPIRAKETVTVEGPQAQIAFEAAADKPGTELVTIETEHGKPPKRSRHIL